MQEGMYYWKTCSGCHVFHENIYYGKTCIVGGHILQADRSCGKLCIMEGMLNERLCLKGGHVLH